MKIMSAALAKKQFNNPFMAMKHKNFRYYWIGMCVSVIGTWMQNIAQPWLAYTLTSSPFLLSLVGALQFTPVLLFSLFAGVIIDKIPKKSLLIITQSSSMIITLVLSILVKSGHIQYWHILVMSTLLGIVNALDMPTRQAFIIELVKKEDLMNAIALNSTLFNLARIIGPALAGIVMGQLGIFYCFLINSISYAAVLISLIFIKPDAVEMENQPKENVLKDIGEGLRYILNHKQILYCILLVGIIGTFAMNFTVLVPVFADKILKQSETGYGFLMSFMGIGSFMGAFIVAAMSKKGPKRFFIEIAPYIVAVFMVFAGMSRAYGFTAICLAIAGFSCVGLNSTANTTVQLKTKDKLRGRVMSVYTMVFAGTTPIGNLLSGALANNFGADVAFIICGIIVFVCALLLVLFKKFYRNDKIIDEE